MIGPPIPVPSLFPMSGASFKMYPILGFYKDLWLVYAAAFAAINLVSVNCKKIKIKIPFFKMCTETMHIEYRDTENGKNHVSPECSLLKDSDSVFQCTFFRSYIFVYNFPSKIVLCYNLIIYFSQLIIIQNIFPN